MSDYGETEAELDDFEDFDPLALDNEDNEDNEDNGEGDIEAAVDKAPPLEDEDNADNADKADNADPSEDEDGENVDEDAPANSGSSAQDTKGTPADAKSRNDDESRALVVVASENRRTSNRMTLAEFTQACATRATIIAKSATVYVGVEAGIEYTDAISLAEREIREHKSPLVCIREVGFTSKGERIVEQWKVNEMSLPAFN
jgi:hypothetical protein